MRFPKLFLPLHPGSERGPAAKNEEAFLGEKAGKKIEKRLLRIEKKFLPLQPAEESSSEAKERKKRLKKVLANRKRFPSFAPRKRVNGSKGVEKQQAPGAALRQGK
ncbi:hypothetical protein H8S84_13365 [Pontibacter sp. SD6]|uniref:Uncharacterized protein n=1 Tax=Pontibacter cellulosilyticus TaxID=1720253 RepID=A0A923N7X1_9BACT|nr:hypothetical protein [Pontibacter cellulosilyticus]